ncbi:MAG: membrane protein insertase YidC, partial [Planctomycetes bacterium]|nr:membrane protein insertase YidC [Planctomycetota bacterium]
LVAGALVAQGGDAAAFDHLFGEPGVQGSFRARFAKPGGGLVSLWATDHYTSYAVGQKDKHEPGDWLLLAWNGSDHALRLQLAQPTAAFPVDPSTAPWTVDAQPGVVTFTLAANGLELVKVVRHDPQLRGFQLEFALRNVSSTATGSLDFVWLGPAPVCPTEAGLFGTLSGSIAAATDGTAVFKKPTESGELVLEGKPLSFAGSSNRFFGMFLVPRDDAARTALGSLTVDTVPAVAEPSLNVAAASSTRLRAGLRLAVPAAGSETRVAYGFYCGPKSNRVFATLPEAERTRFAAILDHDLNAPCCVIEMPGGRPMAKLLLWLLGIFHDVVGNWGVAIMMLTILVRGLLAPLNFRMQKSMRAYGKKMAVLKPKLDALKQQFGDDQRGYQQAMIAFQREHKLMPPLGGCLPIFLTMPIYIGLFTALRVAYDVRQQPFFGWMHDLSVPDHLFTLPFWPGSVNLLPVLWIVMMVFQTLRTPLPNDPQQRQTMQIMRYMPLIFGVMLYHYAAALLVYMVTSMLWSLVEMTITRRILGPIDGDAAVYAPQTM